MDNFDEIIKQQVEEFNAPYNEAHWAEMEGRLNTIRTQKVKKNILVSAGTIAIISVAGYFYLSNHSDNKQITEKASVTTTTEITNPSNESQQKEVVITEQNKQHVNPNTPIVSSSQNDVKENKTEPDNSSEENAKTAPASQVNTTNSNSNNHSPQTTSLKAEFSIRNNTVCMNEEVSFEAKESLAPVSYYWDFGDGTNSTEQNPTHRYEENGDFDVTLTITNRKTGEEAKYSQKKAVTIFPQPSANFSFTETSLKHDDNKLAYPYTKFYVKNSKPDEKYTWNFDNGETSTSKNAQTIHKKKGTYKVSLKVENSYGCESIASKKVLIKNDYTLLAPNAFTPDNDGENDDFIPKALLGWDVQFEMVITDKTGKVVYQSSDKSAPWNGRLNNSGNQLPAGIYLWKVVTYDAEGKAHQHIGKVNLLD